jgi:hypothetical protein
MSTTIITYCVLHLCAIANIIWSKIQLSQFLQKHPAIESERALGKLKRIARQQMYRAIAQIMFEFAGFFVGLILIVSTGIPGVIAIIAARMGLYCIMRWAQEPERKVRSLTAANEELARKYHAVIKSWIHKVLPDF